MDQKLADAVSRRSFLKSTAAVGGTALAASALAAPAIVGAGGVLRTLNPPLSAAEGESFRASAAAIRSVLDACWPPAAGGEPID